MSKPADTASSHPGKDADSIRNEHRSKRVSIDARLPAGLARINRQPIGIRGAMRLTGANPLVMSYLEPQISFPKIST